MGKKVTKKYKMMVKIEFLALSVILLVARFNCLIGIFMLDFLEMEVTFCHDDHFLFPLRRFPDVSKGQVMWKVDEMDSIKLEL